MKKIYKFLTIVVLLFGSLTAKAQNDGIALTLLPHLSYNNFYNPGIRIDQKVVFGVGISNVGLSVYNSSVRYNDLYKFENGVPTALDLNNFIQSLEEHDNYINTDFSLDLVRLGAKFGRFFVDVNWRLRANTEFHYSRDFLGFFINGNGNYLGPDNPANFRTEGRLAEILPAHCRYPLLFGCQCNCGWQKRHPDRRKKGLR